ncbi:MAG: ribonuclease III [Oscillospiraceae bacterium]|nr:ribonuclease III [Oscillospiraceae bacterium]
MSEQDVNKISILGLAHVGDAVYELLTRSRLCLEGHSSVMELHKRTVSRVNAAAQAEAVKKLLPHLTEEELAVYKRGRNAKVHSVPHHADIGQYHAATGLEALFGWLYLCGRTERLSALFSRITEE